MKGEQKSLQNAALNSVDLVAPTTKANPLEQKFIENEYIIFMYTKSRRVTELTESIKNFKSKYGIITHVLSRPSRRLPQTYEFSIEVDSNQGSNLEPIIEELYNRCEEFDMIPRKELSSVDYVPWFPRTMKDMDRFADRCLTDGSELDPDHPGFTDEDYRKRRKVFADIATNFRYGEKIPSIEYTDEEHKLWKTIFSQLVKLYKTKACREHQYIFPLLVENCGYAEDNIPQLQHVSDFLKDCTGFTLRPVAGLLRSRDFLAGLAFRVLHSTQYLRHPGRPFYTPEPDVFHELLGHAPLFADPAFAQFSQEIGLASLGAPDDYIEKLSNLYWFTAEFGMCRQEGALKAYGAGLLSGFGELQYCVSGKPELRVFDPPVTAEHKDYPYEGYQPIYYVAGSFKDAQTKMLEYTNSTPRPFCVQYNAYTQSVEIVDSVSQVQTFLRDVQIRCNAMEGITGKAFQVKQEGVE